MKFIVLTLFPEFIKPLLEFSIIKNAVKKGLIEIEIVDFREFSFDKRKRVDDYQFGGGAGMVLQLQPIVSALKKYPNSHKVLLSPQGELLTQTKLYELANNVELTLICGHYEGFDERISHYIDEEISIGDFVLTNGEIPALVLLDGISRLLSGVIKSDSHINDSFNDGLLDFPVYTKPIDFEGLKVPEVLLSGNHKLINQYRLTEKINKTKAKRPDLYQKYIRGKKNEQDGF